MFWVKNILEIIKELLFSSHANIQFSVETNIETESNTVEDGWEEEGDGEDDVDIFLSMLGENSVPMKNINVPVCSNNCW